MLRSSQKRASQPAGRRAFTLLEVVLAIGLTSIVLYLLMTAVELYLFRVDDSRTRVESAQLARTILDQIAADLTAARLSVAPAQGGGMNQGGGAQSGSAAGGTNQGAGGQTSGALGGASQSAGSGGASSGGVAQSGGTAGGAASGPGGSSSSSSTDAGAGTGGASLMNAMSVQGVYGAQDAMRIDRRAYTRWERASRDVDPQEGSTAGDLPLTVRYYYQTGSQESSQAAAAEGVSETVADDVAGLYRATIPTAELSQLNSSSTSSSGTSGAGTSDEGVRVELLAPEVVGLSLSYFDGSQWWDAWDSSQGRVLPKGVNVKLQFLTSSTSARASSDRPQHAATDRYANRDVVEYERYVALPSVPVPPPAQPLMLGAAGRGGGTGAGQGGAGQTGQSANAAGQIGQGPGVQGQNGTAGGQGGGNGQR